MDHQLMLHRLMGKRKRKRDVAPQGDEQRTSSSHDDRFLLDPVVIDLEDQRDRANAAETGVMVVSSPLRTMAPKNNLPGATRDASSERHSLSPTLTFEVETKGGSTKFSIPACPSPGLEEFPVETTIMLPSNDQAHISASSSRDLAEMVLLKFGLAQQVFRWKLALLPKGTSLRDFRLPPPCDNLVEFDPTPYMKEEDSDDLEGGNEKTALATKATRARKPF
ncbi:unnamed protein product [Cuscuta campestris]|uniref:Uncharacterized protein n=1 Tax=Cuscuta campestris TaxID=132261 RepID=A0A484M539_9ASTE|nr:unnamed protein product [Cuscuta campestris]